VMGVSPRPGDQLYFGQVAAALLEQADCSLLFVVSERLTTVPEPSDISARLELLREVGP
jgi:hypothetical protein